MAKPLPKWIMRHYAALWNRFKDKKFTHEQACKAVKLKKGIVSVLLSDIKKANWLNVSLDPDDSRIRLYRLKSPDKAVKEIK